MIVAEDPYSTSEPTIDSHVVKLAASGADVFFDVTIAKYTAQAIKKIHEIGWKPLHIVTSVSTSISAVMKPAGLEASQGILSSAYLMDSTDSQWRDEPGMKEWVAFMDKWNPGADKADAFNIYGYALARTIVQVLKQCGDDLTRANVMRQAANLKDFEPGVLLPGIKINTSPTDFYPIEQEQLMRFKGETWELFGPVLNGEASG